MVLVAVTRYHRTDIHVSHKIPERQYIKPRFLHTCTKKDYHTLVRGPTYKLYDLPVVFSYNASTFAYMHNKRITSTR